MTTATTDAQATVKVALHCADCGDSGEVYDWRYFEGTRTGEIETLCRRCYSVRLNQGQPLELALGQTVPDRHFGETVYAPKYAKIAPAKSARRITHKSTASAKHPEFQACETPKRPIVDPGDAQHWTDLARARGLRMPSDVTCNEKLMRRWLRRCGLDINWFRGWSGFTNLSDWMAANPNFTLRQWAGLMLEEGEA